MIIQKQLQKKLEEPFLPWRLSFKTDFVMQKHIENHIR